MAIQGGEPHPKGHSHVFLGAGHDRNERKTWGVIALCSTMMVAEIVGGTLFGSLALVADGLHMSTHAAALLIAAFAYTYARRHASDARFAFGTGKLGDLAGFSSAIILAMIALLIGYEAISRLFAPIPIAFDQAIPIAVVGLFVNVASAWLLSGDHDHGHGHGHSHGPSQGHDGHDEEVRRIETATGALLVQVFEDGVPPRFRIRCEGRNGATSLPPAEAITIETLRPDGSRQMFSFASAGTHLESLAEIPEPHQFRAVLNITGGDQARRHEIEFREHDHAHAASDPTAHRDYNMRAAFIHVMADAAVSVLAIVGLSTGRFLGWVWMDSVMGIVGALVIANWSYGLVRDTGGILLDMIPDQGMADALRRSVEANGDELTDLHLWRLGPGHLGAIISIVSDEPRGVEFYRSRLARFHGLSHLTVEVRPR